MPLPSLLDEIDRLFDELIHRPWGAAARELVPAHVREVQDGWIVELPVEGLRAADLKVMVSGRQLTVRGHQRRQREGLSGGRWTQAQHEVDFHRSMMLPGDADPDSVEASIEESTLSIRIRKRRP